MSNPDATPETEPIPTQAPEAEQRWGRFVAFVGEDGNFIEASINSRLGRIRAAGGILLGTTMSACPFDQSGIFVSVLIEYGAPEPVS